MAIELNFVSEAITNFFPAFQWFAILTIALLMAYFFGKVIWEFGMRWER